MYYTERFIISNRTIKVISLEFVDRRIDRVKCVRYVNLEKYRERGIV